MTTRATMKRGDTAPALAITCSDLDGVVDLTSAASIRIIGTQRNADGFDKDVTGDALGIVTLEWDPGDTDLAGDIKIEVEVTWGDATIQTFPNSGYLTVKIAPDLG